MRSKLLLAVSLAALAMPIVAHAAMPGDTCTQAQMGGTVKSDDNKNIIACLLDDAGGYVWKAMTSGGGGMTGGCLLFKGNIYEIHGPTSLNGGDTLLSTWGRGCKKSDLVEGYEVTGSDLTDKNSYTSYQHYAPLIEDGYSCGITSVYVAESSNPYKYITCVKN